MKRRKKNSNICSKLWRHCLAKSMFYIQMYTWGKTTSHKTLRSINCFFASTSHLSLGEVQILGHQWTLDDAVAPRFEASGWRALPQLYCSSVAWLKNEEQHIGDKMTDMDTDRILCNRPQNRYVECSGLTIVLHKQESPPPPASLPFYFEF